MDTEIFLEKIGLNFCGKAAYFSAPRADYGRLSELLKSDRQKFFRTIRKISGYRQTCLKLYVDLAIENRARFNELAIDDEIYFDTFRDIAIWCENCYEKYGEYGLDELEWLYKCVDMRIFRLGRLQFELTVAEKEYCAEGKKLFSGDVVFAVHIPKGAPLDEESVADAFRKSRTFFHGVSKWYTCKSWLLNPKLTELLPADSNIIGFQKLFTALETDRTSLQAEERIFGTVKDDPAEYPETTKLQRAAKRYLMSGGKLGETLGVRYIS